MRASNPPHGPDDTGQSGHNTEKANNAARAHATNIGIKGPGSQPYHDGAGHFMHFCSHPGCEEWGAFGSGVRLLHGKPGSWTCWKHRPERAVKVKTPSGRRQPSGRLL